MRVIAATDQRARLNVAEAHLQGFMLEEGELVRCVEAGHGKMVARGAEVLADGEDVDFAVGEIAEDAEQFVHLFTHADDDAGLGDDGAKFVGAALALGFGEEFKRAFVAAAGFGDAVEAGDGLDVVVEDLGARGDDHAAGFGDALEVGGEDFDLRTRRLSANFVDDVDEGLGSAEVVVIAIDAGNDGVGEAELGNGIGDAAGLFVVDGLGLAFGDRAEAAAAGAEVAEHHEGSGLVVPALTDVGAVGGLADGVEVEVAGQLLEGVEGLTHGGAGLEPGGLGRRLAGRQVDLDQRVGLDERGHSFFDCRWFRGGVFGRLSGGVRGLPCG